VQLTQILGIKFTIWLMYNKMKKYSITKMSLSL